MRRAISIVVLVTILFCGCYFGIMETARPAGEGEFHLNVGYNMEIPAERGKAVEVTAAQEPFIGFEAQEDGTEGDTDFFNGIFQARLDYGLSERLTVAARAGWTKPLAEESPGSLGVVGTLKWGFVTDPEGFSAAVSFGGGYTALGPVVEGTVFMDYFFITGLFGVYAAFRPYYVYTDDGLEGEYQLAFGEVVYFGNTLLLAEVLVEFGTSEITMFVGLAVGFDL